MVFPDGDDSDGLEEFPQELASAPICYVCLRRLGGGGTATVYLARSEISGHLRAIKVLRRELRSDQRLVRSLFRQAEALAKLEEAPYLEKLHQAYATRDGPALDLELIRGVSLAERLREGRLPLPLAIDFGRMLASALAHLHGHPQVFVHFDVKPGNILVTPQDRIRLIDLGFARARWAPNGHDPSEQLELEGLTPEYASPEQIERFRPSSMIAAWPGTAATAPTSCQAPSGAVDHRADIWSWGCVMFECLCGRRPFSDRRRWEYVDDMVVGAPRMPLLPRETPATLKELIVRCLTKNAGERISSMLDVQTELEALSSPRPVSASTSPSPCSLPAETASFHGRAGPLAQLVRALVPGCRVLVHGFPGVGKSTLAVKAAWTIVREHPTRFPDGVCWVDCRELDEATTPEMLATAIDAGTMGRRTRHARRTVRPTTPKELAARLRDRRVLVVLDGIERAQAALDGVLEPLSGRGEMGVLATSIRAARAGRLTSWLLQGMELRPPRGAGRDSEAVEFFLACASRSASGLVLDRDARAMAEEICRQLEGNPFAIELVASRARHGLHLLLPRIRTLPDDESTTEGHRSIGAAIRWCVGTLDPAQAALLTDLAAFRGGATLEAIRAVADESGGGAPSRNVEGLLEGLIDASLVTCEAPCSPAARYRLMTPVRDWLRDHAPEGACRLATAAERHRRHFARMAEQAPRDEEGQLGEEWLDMAEPEVDNFRAALEHAESAGRDQDVGMMYQALVPLWTTRGPLEDARRWTAAALDAARRLDPDLRWRVLNAAGIVALTCVDLDAAERRYREARMLAADAAEPLREVKSLLNMGLVELRRERFELAAQRLEETIALLRQFDHPRLLRTARMNLATVQKHMGRTEEARAEFTALLEECERQCQGRRRPSSMIAYLHRNLGELACMRGDLGAAEAHLVAALGEERDPFDVMQAVLWLGIVAAAHGAVERAVTLLDGAEHWFLRHHRRPVSTHIAAARKARQELWRSAPGESRRATRPPIEDFDELVALAVGPR